MKDLLLNVADKIVNVFFGPPVPASWSGIDGDLLGECDTCGDIYDVSSRDGRCGDCGDCGECCLHTRCEECGEPFEVGFGCEDCKARIVNVTFSGFAGTYFDQPEPAEGVIWCPICQDETDAQFDELSAWCFRHPDRPVDVDWPDHE